MKWLALPHDYPYLYLVIFRYLHVDVYGGCGDQDDEGKGLELLNTSYQAQWY